jgi:hypothetical protein
MFDEVCRSLRLQIMNLLNSFTYTRILVLPFVTTHNTTQQQHTTPHNISETVSLFR